MAQLVRNVRTQAQKELVKIFDTACYRHNRWQVWSDFVVMAAISISNAVDSSHAKAREEMYLTIAKRYNSKELECFAEMFAMIVTAIDRDPDQDFLGDLFMCLGLGNESGGQFFTPYSVCRAMAAMTYGEDLKEKIKKRGWVSVNDPACGAGALLIAFANECRRPGIDINYQTSVLFVAQDIDLIAGCMCYIQLSLLGCPGYVVVANTLTNPCTSIDGNALIPVPSENIWYTPFYFRDVWHWRRQFWRVQSLIEAAPAPLPEPEEIIPEVPAIPLTENKVGQLSFF